jgi:hypothetical protein
MTTINNLPLNEQIREIHRASSRLDYLTREGKEHPLFLELLRIHRASEDAMNVLNELQRKAAA